MYIAWQRPIRRLPILLGNDLRMFLPRLIFLNCRGSFFIGQRQLLGERLIRRTAVAVYSEIAVSLERGGDRANVWVV